MNSLFSVYGMFLIAGSVSFDISIRNQIASPKTVFNADIYDDLISRRVHSSDAEKFAEVCPCPCNGVGWGVIW